MTGSHTPLRAIWLTLCTLIALGVLSFVVIKRPHWVPVLLWRIPYTEYEVGGSGVNHDALEKLQSIRQDVKYRYRILSGYRSKEQNKAVGGAKGSQHVPGIAFDVWVPRSHRATFYAAAKKAGFSAYGWGNRTVHIDLGQSRWWTYDPAGKHVSGDARHQFLHLAPDNFIEDFKLKR